MACCDILFCFPGDPVEGDPRAQYSNKFKVNMLEAPSHDPAWFFYGCLCFPCSQYQLRQMALGTDWPQNYTCCQSYFNCACIQGGKMGEKSAPQFCLCLEVCLCASCAISANRMYIMDKYNLVPDPMDNKIIRFNNCMQCLDCIFSILAIFIDGLQDAREIIHFIAQLVFHITVGCMTAQAHYELFIGGPPGSGVKAGQGAPQDEDMMRD